MSIEDEVRRLFMHSSSAKTKSSKHNEAQGRSNQRVRRSDRVDVETFSRIKSSMLQEPRESERYRGKSDVRCVAVNSKSTSKITIYTLARSLQITAKEIK